MSYMAKGPPTKDSSPNSSGRPIGQAPAGGQTIAAPQLDPNNAFQQTQQQLLSTIQQQIFMQQAAGQVLAHAQNWSSLTQQQTVSGNVPSLATPQHQQLPQNQGNTLYPALIQQQQQQPNITISKVSAPPTLVNQTPLPAVIATPQQTPGNNATVSSAQIPVTQPLAPTTTGTVVALQNNTGMQLGIPAPAKSGPGLSVTPVKVSGTSVSNNVPLSPAKPPALTPLSQTPPKPQVHPSPGAKPVESPNRNLVVTSSAGSGKSVTPVKETVFPPRPISHQNTSSISIVQKTPTKSTLKLATVTPRIKTTPKKSPTTPLAASPQRPPIVPSPVSSNSSANDRPNALIKSKESPVKPPVVAAAASPAKPVEQKTAAPVVKAPIEETKSTHSAVKLSSVMTNTTAITPVGPITSPVTNNLTPTTPQKKHEKEGKVVTPLAAKDSDKKQEATLKKDQTETPKVPPSTTITTLKGASDKPAKETNKETVSSLPKSVEKKEVPGQTKVQVTKKEKPQQVTPVVKAKQPERKLAQTPQTPKEAKSSTSQGTKDGSASARLKRARKGVQPFQSPIPEIENAKKASINLGASTSKEPSEKLTIFYK